MQLVERRFKLLFKFTHFRRNNFKSFAKWQLICHFSKSTQAVTNCTHFCAFKSHAIFYSLNDSTLNLRFQSHLYEKKAEFYAWSTLIYQFVLLIRLNCFTGSWFHSKFIRKQPKKMVASKKRIKRPSIFGRPRCLLRLNRFN